MTHGQLASSRLLALFLLLLCAAPAPAQSAVTGVEQLLGELRRSGVVIIYSSELVNEDMRADVDQRAPLLDRARAALAVHDLALRQLGPRSYVVIRQSATATADAADAADVLLDEISVYASRHALDVSVTAPRELTSTDIERVPGSHDDSLRAVQSLPGVVSTGSARPYIRGSLSEDVLVRYDGITLLDPFHLKNFQSLISAIDPSAIERIEVFSGGFPVQYGTRSGGVIDITPPSTGIGHEHRASLSLLSGGLSTRGRGESRPLEWLAAIRRSTLDQIEPVVEGLGKPQFSDSLGRLRWSTSRGAWTLGWLLLDDQLSLTAEDAHETARARYRDEYVWLAREHAFDDRLKMRSSLVVTSADRSRLGRLSRPGVASGELSESRAFDGLELTSHWTLSDGDRSRYTFGGSLSATRAAYRYTRQSSFAPDIALAFDRDPMESLQYSARPEVVAGSLYISNRRQWTRFEAEVGIRVDGQHYEVNGNHTQISPRLNLRYDLSDDLRVYASAGRFTQAQHAEEWRVEEAQQLPDAAQISVHSIVGLEYDFESGTRIGLEAYTKRWTTVAAYFDSRLDPFTLVPDLAPDRIRVRPNASEASGLELTARRQFAERFTGWGTLAWARVADDFADSQDVLRSWDQPLSLSAGLAWKGSSASLSALAGWHGGWPRTPLGTAPLEIGARNTGRWSDFYSLDLRGSWTWRWPSGDLSLVLDVTNATNRRNACCAVLLRDAGTELRAEPDHWLPAIVNLGLTYRWGR